MRCAKQWLVVNLVVLGITLGGGLLALGCGVLLDWLGDCPAVPLLTGVAGILVFCLPFLLASSLARRPR